jgi:hypothetical protein
MKTKHFEPSQKVIDQVRAIVKLNRDHQAGIQGGCVALFFGDRYTKQEIKYMEAEIKRIEYENSTSYFGICLQG